MSDTTPLEAALVEQISRARWFGGKGRAFTVTDVRLLPLRDGEPTVTIALVTLAFAGPSGSATAADTDVYQLPIASYAEPQDHLAHAFIARLEDRHLYDALHDSAATHAWLEAFAEAGPTSCTDDSGLSFHRRGEHELDLSVDSKLFSGEQSNSSVAFGVDSLMKVFRRVTPGVNPDIEIHDALTRGGADSIADLYGWVELAPSTPDEEPMQLAMLQQFLAGATDGWDLALASARDAVTGGPADFTEEARLLGVAVSEVHELLRGQFGVSPLDGPATAATMRERLAAAEVVVAELAPHAPALVRVFSRLEKTAGDVQRVHGDLHLGQTLRTPQGWKLVDFEGEPVKELAERRLPDSPWRDVAGMLRSFDYAAESVVKELTPADGPEPRVAGLAQDWLRRNRAAFLEGYLSVRAGNGDADEPGPSALTPDEEAVIDAYEADKAVYEVIYEARNRPTWLDIPLQAIDRIGAEK